MRDIQEKKLSLLSDIQKLIEAIDNRLDSCIGTFQADSQEKREIMKIIYLKKCKQLNELAKKMRGKWKNK